MKILITGATGLIGTALIAYLETTGHEVKPLTRITGDQNTPDVPFWNIEKEIIDLIGFEPHVVIHLAGANIAAKRWTDKRKNIILESRKQGTRLLVQYLVKQKNKPKALLSGSAIGFYGLRGDELLDENSPVGDAYVSQVCIPWEAETQAAKEAGIRVVNLRTGVVLSNQDGALVKMLPAFKFGLGGVLGSGDQYFSWIDIDDIISALDFIIRNESIEGAVNLTAPNPVNNKLLTKTLGNVLNRPTPFPMPAFVAKLLFGEMAEELLLGGARVIPKKLQDAGFKFQHATLESSLTKILR